MTRACRHDGCDRPARANASQCGSCCSRRYRERPSWSTADPTDIQLIVHNPRPVEDLTRLERLLIARGLTAKGYTAEQIALVVGASPRTIHRWRTHTPRRAAA